MSHLVVGGKRVVSTENGVLSREAVGAYEGEHKTETTCVDSRPGGHTRLCAKFASVLPGVPYHYRMLSYVLPPFYHVSDIVSCSLAFVNESNSISAMRSVALT